MTARPGRARRNTAILLMAALAAVVVPDRALRAQQPAAPAGSGTPAATAKQGILLRGGVVLVYEVKPSSPDGSVDMEKLVATIRRRLDPDNVREITVRPYGDGNKRIEIIVPNPPAKKGETQAELDPEEYSRIKTFLGTSGMLEFRALAGAHRYQHLHNRAARQQEWEERAGKAWSDDIFAPEPEKPEPEKPDATKPDSPKPDSDKPVARWVTIRSDAVDAIVGNADLSTRRKKIGENRIEDQVLVVLDRHNVNGSLLAGAQDGIDSQGSPCVLFQFGEAGATKFFNLTSTHLPTPAGNHTLLGIILDGVLQSAPRLNEAISSAGQITGRFTEEETKTLAEILTAGALPATLVAPPLRETVIGAPLGEETTKPKPPK